MKGGQGALGGTAQGHSCKEPTGKGGLPPDPKPEVTLQLYTHRA